MTRRFAIILLVTLLSATFAMAQKARSGPFGLDLRGPFHRGFHPHHKIFGHRFGPPSFFFGSPFFAPGFIGAPHFRVFPRRVIRHSLIGFGLQERPLADPDGFYYRAGPRGSGFWSHSLGSPYSYFGPPYYTPYRSSSSSSFVEEWKDRDPRREEPVERQFSFSDSLLLEEGMSTERVMGVLGSPLERIRLGGREVWRYSGYSLVFEDDALKELR
ncbi:MAG TPA: hypothetical protein VLU25_15490 [Acidobacteriota bacterium]|nr:hypothetical protein [Acidobacteriota bacterium]